MSAKQIAYILGGVAATAFLFALVNGNPALMGIYFLGLFAWLKPIIGLTSWWRVVAAAATATLLSAAYPRFAVEASTGEALALNVGTAVLAVALAVALLVREHRGKSRV
jgi:hypothetical protein